MHGSRAGVKGRVRVGTTSGDSKRTLLSPHCEEHCPIEEVTIEGRKHGGARPNDKEKLQPITRDLRIKYERRGARGEGMKTRGFSVSVEIVKGFS